MKLLFYVLVLTLSSVADTVNYTYDDTGRLVNVSYGNGASIAYNYDNAGNLVSRVVTAAPPAGAASEQKPAAKVRKSDLRRAKATSPTR